MLFIASGEQSTPYISACTSRRDAAGFRSFLGIPSLQCLRSTGVQQGRDSIPGCFRNELDEESGRPLHPMMGTADRLRPERSRWRVHNSKEVFRLCGVMPKTRLILRHIPGLEQRLRREARDVWPVRQLAVALKLNTKRETVFERATSGQELRSLPQYPVFQ